MKIIVFIDTFQIEDFKETWLKICIPGCLNSMYRQQSVGMCLYTHSILQTSKQAHVFASDHKL